MFLANKAKLEWINVKPFGDVGAYSWEDTLNSSLVKNTSGNTITFSGGTSSIFKFTCYRYNETAILSQTATVSGVFFNSNYCYSTLDLVVGSGTAAAAVTDYALGNQITDITHISVSTVFRDAGAKITRIFRNTSGSSITISEVGLIIRIGAELDSTSSQNLIPVLIARTVLDDPVTVADNDLFTVVAEL